MSRQIEILFLLFIMFSHRVHWLCGTYIWKVSYICIYIVHKEKDDKLKSSYYADFMRTQVSGFRKTN